MALDYRVTRTKTTHTLGDAKKGNTSRVSRTRRFSEDWRGGERAPGMRLRPELKAATPALAQPACLPHALKVAYGSLPLGFHRPDDAPDYFFDQNLVFLTDCGSFY